MQEALFYNYSGNHSVTCLLCPHECHISEGHQGLCKVRQNRGGTLFSGVYGYPEAMHSDPIEKKPLYHFHPGKMIFSIGTRGCNLRCVFCQNCSLSQSGLPLPPHSRYLAPEELSQMAASIHGNIGMAFTYNEPVVFYEYILDLAKTNREKGLKNVMVSNGFINPEPLQNLLPLTDAWNIDLKAFSEDFYRKHTGGRLKPVLDSIIKVKKSGKHLELTNLVIPGMNDSDGEFTGMVKWIADSTSPDTPLHISRYFPAHLATAPPTPDHVLMRFYELARKHLTFVYLGNTSAGPGRNTSCPDCGNLLISRAFYQVTTEGLSEDGSCSSCGRNIINITNHGTEYP